MPGELWIYDPGKMTNAIRYTIILFTIISCEKRMWGSNITYKCLVISGKSLQHLVIASPSECYYRCE